MHVSDICFICFVLPASAVWIRDEARIRDAITPALAMSSSFQLHHASVISKFVRMFVACSFAAKGRRAPTGYNVLQRIAPHPNVGMRPRTAIVGDIVASARHRGRSDVATMTNQIFGILCFRYHNTAVFWENMKEHFIQVNEHRNMAALRAALAHEYGKELHNPSFMFSTCDGIRAPKKSWRDPALTSLAAWFNVAGLMASELLSI